MCSLDERKDRITETRKLELKAVIIEWVYVIPLCLVSIQDSDERFDESF